jgi:hypothetical protein
MSFAFKTFEIELTQQYLQKYPSPPTAGLPSVLKKAPNIRMLLKSSILRLGRITAYCPPKWARPRIKHAARGPRNQLEVFGG